jgi:cell volume regulation protein A
MFLMLGLLVNPHELTNVMWLGLIIGAAMIFITRPMAVWFSLLPLGSKLTTKARHYISWVGLRGAAPIVLATFPLAAALTGSAEKGETPVNLFNLVFCMVITSVIIQGRTLMPLARFLELDQPLQNKKRMPLEL